jgi:hypothetical protein
MRFLFAIVLWLWLTLSEGCCAPPQWQRRWWSWGTFIVTVVSTHSLCQLFWLSFFPCSDTGSYYIALTMLLSVLDLRYLHRDVLLLACFLWGEDIWDFFVWCGLAADGTFDGASVRPDAVLFNNNWSALITEAVPTGQHCPLKKKMQSKPQWDAIKDTFQNKCNKKEKRQFHFLKYFMTLIFFKS